MSEEQFLEIEALECAYDDEVETYIDIEPKEPEADDQSDKKTKRLHCLIEGCNYMTDRRRDLRRHRRSKKHIHAMAVLSDSDSDFERPLYNCVLCSYTTAKKFCYDRHNKSTKHCRRLEALSDPLKKKKVPLRRDLGSTSSQPSDGNIYTCAPCEYTTLRKESFLLHKTKDNHLHVMDVLGRNNQVITSGPMANSEGVVFTPPESEDEVDSYDRGIFYCDLCDYSTNIRSSFQCHKKSRKHRARAQEAAELENKSECLPGADADSTQAVEIILSCVPDPEQGHEHQFDDTIEYEPEVQEEVVVEHENDFQEIIYLPEEETGEEQHYFIVLGND
ncbi:zinc finger homeobox protein 4 [Drosophila guanche]|uniref:Blast:Zinc finger homeobox protein 3 n=1 Tax=Drosophila guanche TaxID=7266 RepID=A0A3B0KF68_DROGU|nr:zinc finger homeobox protein 4 [Drosophila guanche]SPP83701.1 blast:Zinc finger homeobox protein 3 [Drosophila guanche]